MKTPNTEAGKWRWSQDSLDFRDTGFEDVFQARENAMQKLVWWLEGLGINLSELGVLVMDLSRVAFLPKSGQWEEVVSREETFAQKIGLVFNREKYMSLPIEEALTKKFNSFLTR